MAFDHYTKSALRQAARAELAKGLFWLIAVVALTVAMYLVSEPAGPYFVLWGAMAYGGYRLVRGIYYFLYPEALLKR